MKKLLFLLLIIGTSLRNSAQTTYLDSTFGGSGFVDSLTFELNSFLQPAHIPALCVQNDGRILAAVNLGSPYLNRNVPGVIRMLPNGVKDSSFAYNGIYQLTGSYQYPDVNDMILHPDRANAC